MKVFHQLEKFLTIFVGQQIKIFDDIFTVYKYNLVPVKLLSFKNKSEVIKSKLKPNITTTN